MEKHDTRAKRKTAKHSPSAGLAISLGAAWAITMVSCLR